MRPPTPRQIVRAADDVYRAPPANEGRAADPNRALNLIACPTCREALWWLSTSDTGELHIECATCPPAPAVRFTRDHLRMST